MTKYEKGQTVYKVVEWIAPDDEKPEGDEANEWVIQERRIESVSDKTLKLNRPFSYSYASAGRIPLDVAARTFAISEVEAIKLFRSDRERDLRNAELRLSSLKRALDWARKAHRDATEDRPGNPCSTDRDCQLQDGHPGGHERVFRLRAR